MPIFRPGAQSMACIERHHGMCVAVEITDEAEAAIARFIFSSVPRGPFTSMHLLPLFFYIDMVSAKHLTT
jgi:hypothetical protein